MTVTTVPPHIHERQPWLLPGLRRAGKSLAALLITAVSAVVAPHKASLRRLADIPLTVAGIAGIDFAAFHIAHGWGWLVTGVSLIALEHLIADE